MLPLPGARVGRAQARTHRERDVTLKGTPRWGGAVAELPLQARERQAGRHLPPQLRLNIQPFGEVRNSWPWPGRASLASNRLPRRNRGCCLPSACSSCSSPQELKLIGRLIQAWRVGHWPWAAARKRAGVRARDRGQTWSQRLSGSKTGIAIKSGM